jgi:hypothetical protein
LRVIGIGRCSLAFPYRKILCPVDLDPDSDDALAHVAALATNSGGTLYLLHVVQINPLTAQGAAQGFAGKDFLRFASGKPHGVGWKSVPIVFPRG